VAEGAETGLMAAGHPPLVDKIQHMIPLRSRIPVSRQERARGRCISIVVGLRRPEKPGYGTRRAASRVHPARRAMRRDAIASQASRNAAGELGKPS